MSNDVKALGVYSDRPRPKLVCEAGSSLTKQSFLKECDINHIIKKSLKNGSLPEMIAKNPVYGDFSEVVDYMTSLNIVNRAREQFAALPAHVRARFDNDPATFLSFATDARNNKELVKMGLAKEVVEVVNPSTPSPDAPVPPAVSNPSAGGAGASNAGGQGK